MINPAKQAFEEERYEDAARLYESMMAETPNNPMIKNMALKSRLCAASDLLFHKYYMEFVRGMASIVSLTKALGDDQYRCTSCETVFTPNIPDTVIETQNVYNEYHVYNDTSDASKSEASSVSVSEILPEYSHKDIVRAAWISLAAEDAPLDVFRYDFTDVEETPHDVLVESIKANMSYVASIGYDRQEPYIVTENYRERVNDQWVTRTRTVTKYRTVTDWHVLNGTHAASAVTFVENGTQYLDKDLFRKAFISLSAESLQPITQNIPVINDSAESRAMSDLSISLNAATYASLPGDHQKDVDINVREVTSSSVSIYRTQECETSILYGGTKYTKRTFPFGGLPISGDSIPNTGSMDSQIQQKKQTIPKEIAQKTIIFSILTMVLLAASIVLSLLVPYTAVVIIGFIIALAGFIATRIIISKVSDSVSQRVNRECLAFKTDYTAHLLNALNDKLRSLGLAPASVAELRKGGSYNVCQNCKNHTDRPPRDCRHRLYCRLRSVHLGRQKTRSRPRRYYHHLGGCSHRTKE